MTRAQRGLQVRLAAETIQVRILLVIERVAGIVELGPAVLAVQALGDVARHGVLPSVWTVIGCPVGNYAAVVVRRLDEDELV